MAGAMKILETFRDAVQGLDRIIPSDTKVNIIRSLMNVGFDYLDVGSFVSSRVIPQFSDMEYVMERIGTVPESSRLFALVANAEGAERACSFKQIDAVGFPFSVSETFLRRNINAGFAKAWSSLENVAEECGSAGKEFIVYLAMAFGNPYGDITTLEDCMEWTERLFKMGIRHVYLSDITGVANPEQVASYYKELGKSFPGIEFGLHLHVKQGEGTPLIKAAFDNGCSWFDGVISGLGGCPMTGYEMLQNLPTGVLIDFATENGLDINVDIPGFREAQAKVLMDLAPFS